MKKTILLKSMLLLCALIVGSSYGWADDYQIVFLTNSSDGSTEITSSTKSATVIDEGKECVSSFTSNCSKAYYKCVNGVKLGTSSVSGVLEFNLSPSYQNNIKKIKVVSAKYGSDTGTITLFSGSTSLKSGITPGKDYTHTFDPSTTVSSIKLTTSSKRAYITSITLTIEADPCTVTYGDTGGTVTEESAGAGVTLVSRPNPIGYSFEGWTTSNISPETTTAPSTIISAGAYSPSSDITLYPVYKRSEKLAPTNNYIQITSLANVTEGVYVWVSEKTSKTLRYMPNTISSSSNPDLGTGITTSTESGNVILSNAITADMLWDFTSTGTANQYYIRPHGDATIGIGTTASTGANIRISSSYKDTKWTIAESDDYNWQFLSDPNSMYLAVYNDASWRNYTSSTTNQNGVFYLYKHDTEGSTIYYYNSIPTTSVIITDSKYASFCSPAALDFTDTDVKAFKAAFNSETKKVVLTQVNKVPAGEGVVLYCATANTYNVPVIGGASDVDDNELVGVISESDAIAFNPSSGVYNYILQQGSFKKATGGKLRANRAYLSTSYNVTPSGSHELEMVFEGEEGDVTGISEVSSKKEITGNLYNLNGQRVSTNHKGIVVVNGKKFFNK